MEEESIAINESFKCLTEEFDEKLEELEAKISERLDNITQVIGKRFEVMENHLKKLDRQFLAHDEKIVNLEKKMSELEIKGGPVRVIDNTLKIKPPEFDGSTSFDVFKLQFEAVSSRNSWNDNDKAVRLLMALKGGAADVLQNIPAASRNNYGDIIAALELKYSGGHKQETMVKPQACNHNHSKTELTSKQKQLQELTNE
ncbi:uncharacterized protein [Musca autumnalis]|uniref:uncharacterized protein n=1 Tax=Musca autumnalis TaxID=221902 RepID=UPI003CF909F7